MMLLCSRKLSYVQRWGIVPVIRKQSVAEHSFGVAAISVWLAGMSRQACDRAEVLEYALLHDINEAITGDVPSTFKRYIKDAIVGFESKIPDAEVCELTKVVVKLADYLEALAYINEEKSFGNSTLGLIEADMLPLFDTAYDKFTMLGVKPDSRAFLRNFLDEVHPNRHPGLVV